MTLDEDDLEKLKPHFGHVLLEQRAQIKLKAAMRPKREDPWAVKGEYKYPVEREIQQASPFPVLRPLAGKCVLVRLCAFTHFHSHIHFIVYCGAGTKPNLML